MPSPRKRIVLARAARRLAAHHPQAREGAVHPGGRVTMQGPLLIELGWPAKQLSPNARVHHMVKHRYTKAAKNEAGWATKIARPMDFGTDGPISIHIRAYPPVQRNRDADNLIASLKAHLDGIAAVLGVNDSQFQAPTLEWCDVTERGKLVLVIREAANG